MATRKVVVKNPGLPHSREIISGETYGFDGNVSVTGSVTASSGLVGDVTGDITATDIDAGASGTAGTVDIFPTTASKGKFILSCTDQDGATNVTLKPAAMGQASVISIPDPGATTANVMLTDQANDGVRVTATAAEINATVDGCTATAAEINNICDVSASTEAVTGANVIAASESGMTYFLNSATGFASTLPAPAAGLKFKFIVTTQPTTGNHTVVSNSGANVIEGMADVDSTLVLAANEDSINFVASTALVGDWVEVISDGTSWFVTGQSGATGGITFTVT